nr:MAG: polyprotein 1 [Picornavirales sp.]
MTNPRQGNRALSGTTGASSPQPTRSPTYRRFFHGIKPRTTPVPPPVGAGSCTTQTQRTLLYNDAVSFLDNLDVDSIINRSVVPEVAASGSLSAHAGSDAPPVLKEVADGLPTTQATGAPTFASNSSSITLNALSRSLNTSMVRRLESTILHLIHLCTLNTHAQRITALMVFVHNQYGGPLLAALVKEVEDAAGPQWSTAPHSGEDVPQDPFVYDPADYLLYFQGMPHAGESPTPQQVPLPVVGYEEPGGSKKLRARYGTALDGGRHFLRSPLGVKLRKVFSMCIAGGMLGNDLEAKAPGLHRRLCGDIKPADANSVDIIIDILDLVRHTWDAVVACLIAGNISPLYANLHGAKKIDEKHELIKATSVYYFNGTYKDTYNEDPVMFEVSLASHYEEVKTLHAKAVGPDVAVARRYLAETIAIQQEVKNIKNRKPIRVAPFGLCIYGPTGQGKTALITKLTDDMLRWRGIKPDPALVSWINVKEKFDTSTTNYHKVAILDDLANTKVSIAGSEGLSYIVSLLNNAKQSIHKADVENKGKLHYELDLVVATCNDKTLQAYDYSIEPSALLRRFNYHLDLVVDPAFGKVALPGATPMVDASKLHSGTATQYQRFAVREWVPKEPAAGSDVPNGEWKYLLGQDGGVTYEALLGFLKPKFVGHFAHQERYLGDLAQDRELPVCEHGLTTAPFCSTCTPSIAARPQRPLIMAPHAGFDPTDWFFPAPANASGAPAQGSATVQEAAPIEQPTVPLPSSPAPGSPSGAPSASNSQLPAGWRARASEWWNGRWYDYEPPPPPTAPIGYLSAMLRKGFDWEREAVCHPARCLFIIFGLIPCAFSSAAGGLVALLFGSGYGWWTFLLAGLGAVGTVSRTMHTYVKCRVSGMTFAQIRTVMANVVISNAGLLMAGLFVLTLSGAAAIYTYRALFGVEESSSPQASTVINVTTNAAPAPSPTAAPTPASQPAPPQEPAAVTAAIEEAMAPHGVCISKPQAPEMPVLPTAPKFANSPQDHWPIPTVQTHHVPRGVAATMTREQALSIIHRHMYRIAIYYASGQLVTTNGLMVATGYMLLPKHNLFVMRESGHLPSKIDKIVARRSGPPGGPHFSFRVGTVNLEVVSGDLALVQCLECATQRGIMEFIGYNGVLPPTLPVEEHSRVSRDKDSYDISVERYLSIPREYTNAHMGVTYPALVYERPYPSFHGLCGALLISTGKPSIVAIHTMGSRDGSSNEGVAIRLNHDEVAAAIERLRVRSVHPGPIVSQQHTEPFTQHCNETLGAVVPLHPRSVLHQSPDGSPNEALGSDKVAHPATQRTELRISPHSGAVASLTGQPRQHEPPPNIGKAAVEVKRLQEFDNHEQIDPDIFSCAVRDYRDELYALVDASPELQSVLAQPLSNYEAVNGIAGCASVKRINMSTSMGFSAPGRKSAYTIPDPRPDYPDGVNFPPGVWDDVAKAYEVLAQLQRPNFVAKWSHKDEAVKIGKKKNRVFEGPQLPMLLIFRQLFGPVLRVFALCPMETSSAVGIDATGLQWDQMFSEALSVNPLHAIEGDYPHFDTSSLYQEVITGLATFVLLAKKYSRYTPDMINCMWALAEDVARRICLVRADYLQANSALMTGFPGTVISNNHTNACRKRSAFYGTAPVGQVVTATMRPLGGSGTYLTMGGITLPRNWRDHLRDTPLRPGLSGRYADYVFSLFYGDDFVSVPVPELTWFNQFTISAWFERQGKGMTNANKAPFDCAYTPWSDISFLKRGIRFDELTGALQAPLKISSIYKPMHVIPTTFPFGMEFHYAQLIDAAVRELYLHGPEVYNDHRPGLIALAAHVGCTNFLQSGGVPTYAATAAAWCARVGITVSGIAPSS